MRRRRFIDLAAMGGVAMAAAPSSWAVQPYPSRPVRVVVPLAAGGNMDAMTRLITERLAAVLGQPVIVDNRPGATGMIGANAVAKAEPDGHTVLFAISSVVQSIRLQKNPPYALRELASVTQLADLPVAFGIAEALGARDLAGFVNMVKQRPGKLSYGSYGIGSSGHIIGEMLKRTAGMNIVHVPYKGEAPAISDLLGGQVSAVFGSAGAVAQHPGKIRMVAVSGARRLSRYPDAPTFDEAGFPLGGLTGWAGAFAPASTPVPIIERLRVEIDRIVRLPDIAARILDFGFEPMGETATPFATFVQDQYDRWGAAIKDANIEPE
ncbi:tripartite tricarboxylate transporter substrate-binding protein [Vineibacter terrae]|uniref:tripartite tricarboxylate transporter substrate-binding protein n=1 Tax=Vineibacter terrae TaxID=2586908 RepID=UPI002E3224E6|nr:tripartite tricarboxylate transporter substrate-binding protein [Vineibacter terrae]HEX2891029.1 tripartite tricarboxylate transporter substrate-binding protein [Vineibacter terrae]